MRVQEAGVLNGLGTALSQLGLYEQALDVLGPRKK